MSTQLFLLNDNSIIPGIGSFQLSKELGTARGSGVTSGNTTTTASGNHIVATALTNTICWAYRVNAVTISGAITVNLWGNEDAMATNTQVAIIISRYDSSKAFVSDVVAQGNANHAFGTELGTANAVQNWSVTTPTSTTFADGDWLVVSGHADASGTMASGIMTIFWNGTTSAASGDAFVTFTETITAYTPPVAGVPYTSPYPQLLPQ